MVYFKTLSDITLTEVVVFFFKKSAFFLATYCIHGSTTDIYKPVKSQK